LGRGDIPEVWVTQVNKRGRHWTLWVALPGPTKNAQAAWNVVKPVALKAGWTAVSVNPNGGFLVLLRYNQNGVEAWLNAVMDQTSPTTVSLVLDFVEVTPPPLTLKEPSSMSDPRQEVVDQGRLACRMFGIGIRHDRSRSGFDSTLTHFPLVAWSRAEHQCVHRPLLYVGVLG